MTFERIRPDCCRVCSQVLDGGRCPNWLCSDRRRRIARIRAIAYLSGDLRSRIHEYKYNGRTGWALIFGRLLIGWLEQNAAEQQPDLIVANPTYIASGTPGFAHTEAVLAAAEREDVLGRWAFDVGSPATIVKTGATAKSAGSSASAKRAAAKELQTVLRVPDRALTAGKSILVYDDVCTTGSQLDAVAAVLLDQGGAASVEGIVLARAPWRERLPQSAGGETPQ